MKTQLRSVLAFSSVAVSGLLTAAVLVPDRASALRPSIDPPTLPVTTTVPELPVVPTVTVPDLLPTTTTVTVPGVTTVTTPDPVPTTTATTTTNTTNTITTITTTTTPADPGQAGAGTTGPPSQEVRSAPSASGAACRESKGLPDRRCTPGAARAVTARSLCAQKRAAEPAVPAALRKAVLAQYKISGSASRAYRLDYLISRSLGGTAVRGNVWPQPASGTLGFAEKNRLEQYLLSQVCRGKLGVRAARLQLTGNWIRAYRRMAGR